jgi:endoglucanase
MTNRIEPDIGFAIDTSIAGDTPGVDPDSVAAKLGKGPVMLIYDATMVPHTGLRNLVMDVAEAEGITLQFDRIAAGGTDGGRIHIFGAGVPSLVVGVPVRYIHSHTSIMHIDDFVQAVDLLVAVIKRLDLELVEQLRG